MTTAERTIERFRAASTDEGALQALTVEMQDEVDFVVTPEPDVVIVVFLDSSVIRVTQEEGHVMVQAGVFIRDESPASNAH